jgi:hypothetical protein
MTESHSAFACAQILVIQNPTNFQVRQASAQGSGITQGGWVYSVTAKRRSIEVSGSGAATFTVVLSNGKTLTEKIPDVCAATKIDIWEDGGGDLLLRVH